MLVLLMRVKGSILQKVLLWNHRIVINMADKLGDCDTTSVTIAATVFKQ
jgi:hypothetical protein